MRKHLIYLASGSSRRFGSNKLLHLLDGKPMFRYGLETLAAVASRQENCTLTVVSRYAEIRETAQSLGIRAVDSPESAKGISHTIKAGLKALPIAPEDYLLFQVADQPWLTERSLERLLALAGEGVECASLCHGTRPGNPTLFSAKLLPELLALEGDTGGRAVLKRHKCVFVEAQTERELEDVDTP